MNAARQWAITPLWRWPLGLGALTVFGLLLAPGTRDRDDAKS